MAPRISTSTGLDKTMENITYTDALIILSIIGDMDTPAHQRRMSHWETIAMVTDLLDEVSDESWEIHATAKEWLKDENHHLIDHTHPFFAPIFAHPHKTRPAGFNEGQTPFTLYVSGDLELLNPEKVLGFYSAGPLSSYGSQVINHLFEPNQLVHQATTLITTLGSHVGRRVLNNFAIHESINAPLVIINPAWVEDIYPKESGNLVEHIEERVIKVSAYPPTFTPYSFRHQLSNMMALALAKETIIPELSTITPVIEETLMAAHANNRQLLAVPGSVFAETSRGSNQLIEDCLADILTLDKIGEQ